MRNTLNSVPIFIEIAEHPKGTQLLLPKLMQLMRPLLLHAGTVLFRAGTFSEDMFILQVR